ncbi:unnamed protein product, partial [Staurois parvus]
MYTDHQSTDDQCALMICVAPAASPVSVHQLPISATSMPHISAHLSCLLVSPISSISAAYQCHQCCLSVPPISAIYECCLSVPISDACQCPSVPVLLSVPPISVHQYNLSVPITSASLAHIS